jgi:hypothetical protein
MSNLENRRGKIIGPSYDMTSSYSVYLKERKRRRERSRINYIEKLKKKFMLGRIEMSKKLPGI